MFLMASLGGEPPDRMHISVSQNEGPRSPVSESAGVSIEISHSGALPQPQQSELGVGVETGNLSV